MGKTKNALPDLNSVLEIRPDFTQAKTKRGDLYIKQGEYDKAAIDFEKDAEKRQLIQVRNRYTINRPQREPIKYFLATERRRQSISCSNVQTKWP